MQVDKKFWKGMAWGLFFSLILWGLIFAGIGWAATYYVRPDGTVLAADKANATSCSATSSTLNITQVNAATFSGDDIIDGCGTSYTHRAMITPPSAGTSGHQVTFQNFKIYGSDLVTGVWDQNPITSSDENIGDTTAPGSSVAKLGNYIYYHKVTTASAGTVGSVKVYFQAKGADAKHVKCSLYALSAGDVGAFVTNGATEEKHWSDITINTLTTFTFGTPPSVTASTVYFIGIWSDDNYEHAKGAGGSGGNWGWQSLTYGAWPDPGVDESGLGNYSDVDVYMVVTPTAVNLPANSWKVAYTDTPTVMWFLHEDGSIHWGTKETVITNVNAAYDWYLSGAYLVVYSATNPSTAFSSIEAAVRVSGIKWNAKDYLTFKNSEVAFTKERGIDFGAQTGCIADGNYVHHTGPKGGALSQGIVTEGTGTLIKNNIITETGMHSISIASTTGSTVSGVIAEFNICSNSYHSLIDLQNVDGTFSDAIIRFNYLFNEDYDNVLSCDGINIGGTSGTQHPNNVQVYYNLIKNIAGIGIQVYFYCHDIALYNNTIRGTHPGYAGTSIGIALDGSGGKALSNITVKNNIGVDMASMCFYLSSVAEAGTPTVDNNLWYQSGGGTAVYVEILGTADYHFDDFAAYKAAISGDTSGKWEDPKFISATDLRLRPSSPAINAGANVSLTSDYGGRKIPVGAPDMGAYELSRTTSKIFGM